MSQAEEEPASSSAVPIPFEMVNGRKVLKRSDWWRLGYRVQRYMSYLSDDELYTRLIDVFANLTPLTPEGKIGFPPILGPSPFPWMELWAHVIEEYGLRGMGMPGGFVRDVPLPKIPATGPAKGTNELMKTGLNPAGHLIKYGKEAWLKETLQTGRWRVSPATHYASGTLCAARRDSEMEFSYRIPKFKRHPRASNELNDSLPDSLCGVTNMNVFTKSDYYLACFARTFIHRLFDDFEADSCLIVTDEKRFTEMMRTVLSQNPTWVGMCQKVEYVDPMLPKRTPDIYFAKHFRYAYQDEFRFVWLPRPGSQRLDPMYVELGPLTDCCELLTLSTAQEI